MNQIWTQLKRWGWPWVTRIGLALPLLLGLGALLMLVAIWWLGPQWTWREQQPLASVAHRSVASLVLVLVPLLCWLGCCARAFAACKRSAGRHWPPNRMSRYRSCRRKSGP